METCACLPLLTAAVHAQQATAHGIPSGTGQGITEARSLAAQGTTLPVSLSLSHALQALVPQDPSLRIEGADPDHPHGGCAFGLLSPDPVTACGQLCARYASVRPSALLCARLYFSI